MPLVACLIGSLASTLRDLVSKSLASQVSGIVSASASFLYATPIYLLLILTAYLFGLESLQIGSSFFLLVVLRSLTDGMAEWLKMCSLKKAEISLVSPFFSLAPLFLLFTSPLITGDELTWQSLVGVVIVIIGTLIIGFKSFSTEHSSRVAILLALGSAFFLSLNSCFDRLAVQVASPLLSSASMNVGAALILVPFCFNTTSSSQLFSNHKSFFSRAFFEVLFMVSKLYALQYMTAPEVMGIMRISIVLSVIAGWRYFNEQEIKRRLVGSLLILIGTLVII